MRRLQKALLSYARAAVRGGLPKVIDLMGSNTLAWERRNFEAKFGLDAGQPEMLEDLTVTGDRKSDGFYYAPSPPRIIHAFLSNVPNTVASSHTFIDFGSGKGLALLVAAEYGFKSIIGVEFAYELHEVAVRNIERYKIACPGSPDIRSVSADASTFPIPPDDCVLYFCNPFNDSVMRDVVANINDAFEKWRQHIYVLYYQAVEEDDFTRADPVPLFEASPFLSERRFRPRSTVERLLLRHLRLKIYETTPSSRHTLPE